MAGPATTTDLQNRSLRTLTSGELEAGDYLLEDAYTILLARVPSVADRLAAVPADLVFRALVVQIQCAMVMRVLNNPDGKFEEAGDDYRYRRDSAVSTGMLYLADSEFALLGAGDSGSEGAFTIRPYSNVTTDLPDEWHYL